MINIKEKFKILKNIISSDNSEYLLFEHNDDVGVIFCDEESEPFDFHCEDCISDVSPYRIKGSKELLTYLIISVGPTKFNRIKNGWRDSTGIDLNKVRFTDE